MKYYFSKYFLILDITLFIIIGIIIENLVLSPHVHLYSFNSYLWIVGIIIFATHWHFPNQLWIIWIFWILIGYLISSTESISYQKNSLEMDQQPYGIGKIVSTTHYTKMIQHKVESYSTNSHRRSNFFIVNDLSLDTLLHPGQVISTSVPLVKIQAPKNQFDFDALRYWRTSRVSHQCFVKDHQQISILQDGGSKILFIQKSIESAIANLYPDSILHGLVAGLLLGRKENVDATAKSNFKKIGALHILAVSGLHVGLLISILYILLLPFRILFYQQAPVWILLIILTWMFALIVGLKIPIVRASTLATFYLLSKIIQRNVSKWHMLSWAALLLVLWQPQYLFSVGFQLSFSAVIGILLFYPILYNNLQKAIHWSWFSGLIAVSLAAQIGTFPFLIHYFNQFSAIGIIASLAIIPLLFPFILIVVLNLIFYLLLPWGCIYLSAITDIIAKVIMVISSWLASSDRFLFYLYFPNQFCILLGITLLITGLCWSYQYRVLWMGGLTAILAVGYYGLDCYTTRVQTQIEVYYTPESCVIDVFTGGKVYSSHPLIEIEEILKMRKRYYIVESDTLPPLFKINQKVIQIIQLEQQKIDIKSDLVIVQHKIPIAIPIQFKGEVISMGPILKSAERTMNTYSIYNPKWKGNYSLKL